MKIVVVEESTAETGRLSVCVQEKDIWALEVLLARAGTKALSVSDLAEAEAAVRKEQSHAS